MKRVSQADVPTAQTPYFGAIAALGGVPVRTMAAQTGIGMQLDAA
jgi:hypothetical protein